MTELHFYPGQNLLIVKDKGVVAGRYEAWGGPSTIGSDPRMAEEPTWPGVYVIDKAHAYRTNTWPLSRITWGTQLKNMPAKNDVWYQLPGGQWGSIKSDHKISRTDIIKLYHDLYKGNQGVTIQSQSNQSIKGSELLIYVLANRGIKAA